MSVDAKIAKRKSRASNRAYSTVDFEYCGNSNELDHSLKQRVGGVGDLPSAALVGVA